MKYESEGIQEPSLRPVDSQEFAASLQVVDNLEEFVLSEEAHALREAEYTVPMAVHMDKSLRLKVLDQCGMACVFCHNEGTPVTVDNVRNEPGEFISSGKSSRVSIFLDTNGADFVSGMVQPDRTFETAVHQLKGSVEFDEVHLTGGEPTLHPNLPEIVRNLKEDGNEVKITSNGERFFAIAPQLKDAGWTK